MQIVFKVWTPAFSIVLKKILKKDSITPSPWRKIKVAVWVSFGSIFIRLKGHGVIGSGNSSILLE